MSTARSTPARLGHAVAAALAGCSAWPEAVPLGVVRRRRRGAGASGSRVRWTAVRGIACSTNVMDAEERRGFASTFFVAGVSAFLPPRRSPRCGVRRASRASSSHGLREIVLARLWCRPARRLRGGRGRGAHRGGATAARSGRPRSDPREPAPLLAHDLARSGRASRRTGAAGLAVRQLRRLQRRAGLPARRRASVSGPWNPETRACDPGAAGADGRHGQQLVPSDGQRCSVRARALRPRLSTLKRDQGVAAVDWHEYTSFPGSRPVRSVGKRLPRPARPARRRPIRWCRPTTSSSPQRTASRRRTLARPPVAARQRTSDVPSRQGQAHPPARARDLEVGLGPGAEAPEEPRHALDHRSFEVERGRHASRPCGSLPTAACSALRCRAARSGCPRRGSTSARRPRRA